MATIVELTEKIATELDMPKTQVRSVLDALAGQVLGLTLAGENVQLKGLGVFRKKVIKPKLTFGKMSTGRTTVGFRCTAR